MKKILALLIFAALLPNIKAQNNSLREVVAIVRPVFSETTTLFLDKFGTKLKDEGYDSLSVQLKRYTKGNFYATGFAYTNPKDSQVYVLTNRHVLTQAQSINVEFALEDMSMRTFSNCRIVAIDFEKGLAMIALPESAKLD